MTTIDTMLSFSFGKEKEQKKTAGLESQAGRGFYTARALPSVGLCYSHRRAIHFNGLFNDVEETVFCHFL